MARRSMLPHIARVLRLTQLLALLQVADERLIAVKQAARKQVRSGTQILDLVGD
jgi:hypothetical protein